MIFLLLNRFLVGNEQHGFERSPQRRSSSLEHVGQFSSSIAHAEHCRQSGDGDPRCSHCGKLYCQIDFIFSWISRHDDHSTDQQNILDQRIQEIISKFLFLSLFSFDRTTKATRLFRRCPSTDPQNVCEQRLLHWYNSMKNREKPHPSSVDSISQLNSSDYHQYLLSQSVGYSPEEPLFSPSVYERLATCPPIQSFATQNRAGFYQLCSNGCYILADDSCQTYQGHRLSQSMRCLTIYNQYEEQCVLMLPEFNPMSQMDSIQSLTWHEQFQIFLFIT